MSDRARLPLVLFVAVPAAFGGSNRSVATFIEALRPFARCVLASPADGKFLQYVSERNLLDDHIPLPHGTRGRRLTASWAIARWAFRHRRELTVIHAQATTGLNLAAPAAVVTGKPVVARISDPVPSATGRRLGPWVRRMIRNLTVVPVSETARDVAVAHGLCRPEEAIIVPEPVVPEDVVATRRLTQSGVVTVGFLGGVSYRKGFDLLPEAVAGIEDLPARWLLFVGHPEDEQMEKAVAQLKELPAGRVEFRPRELDVRQVYAQCDVVFVPSRSESFCLVVAEAMANGIPVVASGLPPIRGLLGPEEAGLMFEAGDAQGAVTALRRVVQEEQLRQRLGQSGRLRSADFAPEGVLNALAPIYGVPLFRAGE